MTIQKVGVIGGSGLLGSKVVDSLINASFQRIDITSVDSIKDAVAGQDAVVSTVTTMAAGGQKIVIDAVVAARVRRFIPSKFGIPSRQNRDSKIGKLVGAKIENTDYLIELTGKYDWFSWTGLSPRLFLEAVLKNPLSFIDIKNRKFRLIDSGNEPYSTSSLPYIGNAVAAIIQKPEETANKYLNITGLTTTQNEVLKVVEELTGDKFEVTHVSNAESVKVGDEKLVKGDYSAFGNYLEQLLFADESGNGLKGDETAIGLLGLEEENLEEVVEGVLADIN